MTYDDRLTFLSLDSLELLRLKADLLLTYKIIFALVDVDCDNYFNVRRDNITRGHRFRIIPEHSVINRRKFFFQPKDMQGLEQYA